MGKLAWSSSRYMSYPWSISPVTKVDRRMSDTKIHFIRGKTIVCRTILQTKRNTRLYLSALILQTIFKSSCRKWCCESYLSQYDNYVGVQVYYESNLDIKKNYNKR